jgi:hypothetical protein
LSLISKYGCLPGVKIEEGKNIKIHALRKLGK